MPCCNFGRFIFEVFFLSNSKSNQRCQQGSNDSRRCLSRSTVSPQIFFVDFELDERTLRRSRLSVLENVLQHSCNRFKKRKKLHLDIKRRVDLCLSSDRTKSRVIFMHPTMGNVQNAIHGRPQSVITTTKAVPKLSLLLLSTVFSS